MTETLHRLRAPVSAPALPVAGSLSNAQVRGLSDDGRIEVEWPGGATAMAAWLENGANAAVRLAPGDPVLVLVGAQPDGHVVMGRVGRHPGASRPEDLVLEAGRSLTLRCGAASVDLRADGRVAVRGEDVLLRASGTQRIRAGTVAIN